VTCQLDATYPTPSGWKARCVCGHIGRGPREDVAVRELRAHIDGPRHIGDVLDDWVSLNGQNRRVP